MRKRPFFSTAVFAVLGRSGGLAIPFLIAMVYGASRTTDAFFFAYGIVFALIAIFIHIFESALIPFLAEQKGDARRVSGIANSACLVSLPFILAFSVGIGLSLKPVLMTWSGWSAADAGLVQKIFWELLPLLLLNVLLAAGHSVFYTHRIFWLPALSPLLRSLVVIAFLFGLNQTLGIRALTAGFSIGEGLRGAVVLVLLLRLTPWVRSVLWRQARPVLGGFFKEAVFQMLAVLAINLVFISDQWFASRTGSGELSLFSYADVFMRVPYLLFYAGFLPIFLADWSQTYSQENAQFWPKVQQDMTRVLLVTSVLSLLVWLLRDPLIGWVYGTKNLTDADRGMLTQLVGWLALGFVPGCLRSLFGRVLITLKRSKFYLFQSASELTVNIFLNALWVGPYGVVGIAKATVCAYLYSAVLLYGTIQVARRRAKKASYGKGAGTTP